MAAYLVVDTDWKDVDLDVRMAFAAAARPVIAGYGGKFLTPTPPIPPEPLEGDWNPAILTIVEFPDADTIREMVNSRAFREAVAIRKRTSAEFKIVLAEGV